MGFPVKQLQSTLLCFRGGSVVLVPCSPSCVQNKVTCSVSTSTAVPDTQHWYCISPKDDKFTDDRYTYHQVISHNNENVVTNNYFRSINHKQQIKLEAHIIFRSRLNLLKPKAKKNSLKAIFWLFIIYPAAEVVENEMSLSSSLPCGGKNCRSKLPSPFILSGMLMCDMPSGTPLCLYWATKVGDKDNSHWQQEGFHQTWSQKPWHCI